MEKGGKEEGKGREREEKGRKKRGGGYEKAVTNYIKRRNRIGRIGSLGKFSPPP